LQEQLLYKRYPDLEKSAAGEFEAALLRAVRINLCRGAWSARLQQSNELFTGPEQTELTRLAEWARSTKDGSLSDLTIEPDPKVWGQFAARPIFARPKPADNALIVSINRPASVF